MPYSVLIIDDHTLFNDGLTLILKESKLFQIIGQIYDSRQGVRQCHKLKPDLVLLDYNMPHMNGLEVAKELKKLVKPPKIVIITMYSNHDEVAHFKQVGIDGFITKTTPAVAMVNTLIEVMTTSKLVIITDDKKSVPVKDNFNLLHKFTNREIDILRELKKGKNTIEIAAFLGLSHLTIETHRKNINKKMPFKNKVDYYQFLKELDIE